MENLTSDPPLFHSTLITLKKSVYHFPITVFYSRYFRVILTIIRLRRYGGILSVFFRCRTYIIERAKRAGAGAGVGAKVALANAPGRGFYVFANLGQKLLFARVIQQHLRRIFLPRSAG